MPVETLQCVKLGGEQLFILTDSWHCNHKIVILLFFITVICFFSSPRYPDIKLGSFCSLPFFSLHFVSVVMKHWPFLHRMGLSRKKDNFNFRTILFLRQPQYKFGTMKPKFSKDYFFSVFSTESGLEPVPFGQSSFNFSLSTLEG